MTYSMPRGPRGNRSVQAYANIGLETEVLSAPPERLITLLYDGALAAIAKARLYMDSNNIAGRGTSISKAIDIIESGLKASLNLEAGGELAKNLSETYDLMVRNLLLANLNNDKEKLQLAETMLKEIADAWKTSVDRPKSATPAT
ncbi:flagellar export chaperone FliS [Neopusillimonas aromaticivorans]|uniref:flagellar export chaperone FliS n=1 Tax=Neopusillimonas aromaticivorans TaxID=2979868 RepID=UPI002594152D|nr:flagellar export chaperone FliS [Neopusillimonas aromaticivorans]NLZ12078.1 flagellar export chaperone FliS [Alcaligenaceae bacterium]WJJ93204.1 flagellar export chaperone FliS [Neopusillimonas aromaticivorans]